MKKKGIYTVMKFCVFFLIANLPFLTVTFLFGIDTFVDSFKYPNSYVYIKNNQIDNLDTTQGYILLEKPTHHGYIIKEGDTILYQTKTETVQRTVIHATTSENGLRSYYTRNQNKEEIDGPVHDYQIIGTIKGKFEDNIWNKLCIQIWELSINNFNAKVLFPFL